MVLVSVGLNDLYNPDFTFRLLFNAQYSRNGSRYRHSYDEVLIGLMPYSFRMTLSDLD